MATKTSVSFAAAALVVLAAAGCGSTGSSSTSKSAATPPPAAAATTSTGPSPTAAPGALSAEATSAATGDIPDNQVFLVFSSRAAGFSMKYPEGWTQSASGRTVTFANKNNLVRIVIGSGPAPTAASVAAQLASLKSSQPGLNYTSPRLVQLPSGAAFKARYTTQSKPDPVTGRRVTLVVDRYVVARGSRVATVDLGTPVGVDNVDAYRKMIQSFRWL